MTYLSTEIVELAKEVGFDEEPIYIKQESEWEKEKRVKTPTVEFEFVPTYTLQQVEEWLWEKHKIVIETRFHFEFRCSIGVWKLQSSIPVRIHESAIEVINPFQLKEQGVRQALEWIAKNKV